MPGYRYYDTKKVDPLFPFGYGLSYTKFQYSNLTVQLDSSSFSYYKQNIHDFGMDYDSFNIMIGGSSRDILLQQSINIADKSAGTEMNYSLLPENHASDVRPLQDFRFITDHPVYFDTNKSLLIKDSLTGSVVENLNYLGGTGSDTLIFGNSVPLKAGVKYYIEIDSGAIIDYFNHPFKGFKGEGKWDFSVTATGIQNHSAKLIFDIYPNPAGKYIGFHFKQSILNIKQISLFNAFSQCVDQIQGKQITSDSFNYSCSYLANGIYFCRVTIEKGVFVNSFAVQK